MYNYNFLPGSGGGCDDLPPVDGEFPMPNYDGDLDPQDNDDSNKSDETKH